MVDESQRPSMDGIRSNRSTAAVSATPSPKPTKPASKPDRQSQPTDPAQNQITSDQAVAAPKPRRRLRRFIVFVLSLAVIAAVLFGVYWTYLNFYI